jgi:hypothetical protein
MIRMIRSFSFFPFSGGLFWNSLVHFLPYSLWSRRSAVVLKLELVMPGSRFEEKSIKRGIK